MEDGTQPDTSTEWRMEMKDQENRGIPHQEAFPAETLLAEIYARHRAGKPHRDDDKRLGIEVMSRHFDRYDSFGKLRDRLDWYCDEHQRMDAAEKAAFMEWLTTRYRAEFGYEMFE